MVQGAGAAQALLRAGQLDEMELHVVPVLLGQGRRLFDNLPPVRHLAAPQGGRRLRPRRRCPGHAAPPVLLGEQVIGVGLDEQLPGHRVHRGLLVVLVSGMTSCRQLARHAGWPSVTGPARRCQLADTHDPGSGGHPARVMDMSDGSP
jgi:hypothetical protein